MHPARILLDRTEPDSRAVATPRAWGRWAHCAPRPVVVRYLTAGAHVGQDAVLAQVLVDAEPGREIRQDPAAGLRRPARASYPGRNTHPQSPSRRRSAWR